MTKDTYQQLRIDDLIDEIIRAGDLVVPEDSLGFGKVLAGRNRAGLHEIIHRAVNDIASYEEGTGDPRTGS